MANKVTNHFEFRLSFWNRLIFLFNGFIKQDLTIYFDESGIEKITSNYDKYRIDSIITKSNFLQESTMVIKVNLSMINHFHRSIALNRNTFMDFRELAHNYDVVFSYDQEDTITLEGHPTNIVYATAEIGEQIGMMNAGY
jgi:hypothetical protein